MSVIWCKKLKLGPMIFVCILHREMIGKLFHVGHRADSLVIHHWMGCGPNLSGIHTTFNGEWVMIQHNIPQKMSFLNISLLHMNISLKRNLHNNKRPFSQCRQFSLQNCRTNCLQEVTKLIHHLSLTYRRFTHC